MAWGSLLEDIIMNKSRELVQQIIGTDLYNQVRSYAAANHIPTAVFVPEQDNIYIFKPDGSMEKATTEREGFINEMDRDLYLQAYADRTQAPIAVMENVAGLDPWFNVFEPRPVSGGIVSVDPIFIQQLHETPEFVTQEEALLVDTPIPGVNMTPAETVEESVVEGAVMSPLGNMGLILAGVAAAALLLFRR